MRKLNWNETGVLSFSATALITILLILCYTLDSWEVVTYQSEPLQSLIQNAGLNISTHEGYYVITLNSTVTVQNEAVPERVLLVETLKTGMWKSCVITNADMTTLVDSSPDVLWATDVCTYYRPVGASSYTYASGRYVRHMMTRTAQSCMIVSCICVFGTLALGTTSFIIKHVILSMIASTLCFAAAAYQMFSMALMLKRQFEAKQHLDVPTIPVSLESAMNVSFGTSTYLSIICQMLATASVVLWISHTKTLRGAIKLYIAETKHTLFCRT